MSSSSRRVAGLGLSLLTGALACSSANDVTGATAATGRHPTTSVSSGSLGSTGAASTGGGTSTGSGSTATSGGSSSSSTGGTLPSCDAGIQVAWQIESLCAMSNVGAGIPVTNLLNPSMSTLTDGTGAFYFCVAAGTPLAFSVEESGYLTTVSELIQAGVSETLPHTELLTYCNAASQEIASTLSTSTPPFNTNLAVAAVIVDSQGVCSRAGWQISLTLPDGGPLAGQGVAYFSGVGLDPSLVATGIEGGSLVYNIDPSLERVAISAKLLDAGPGNICSYLGTQPPFQLTGLLPVQGPGSISYGIYPIP